VPHINRHVFITSFHILCIDICYTWLGKHKMEVRLYVFHDGSTAKILKVDVRMEVSQKLSSWKRKKHTILD